jgi:hypothetical protein
MKMSSAHEDHSALNDHLTGGYNVKDIIRNPHPVGRAVLFVSTVLSRVRRGRDTPICMRGKTLNRLSMALMRADRRADVRKNQYSGKQCASSLRPFP